jgi:hypothetical protein
VPTVHESLAQAPTGTSPAIPAHRGSSRFRGQLRCRHRRAVPLTRERRHGRAQRWIGIRGGRRRTDTRSSALLAGWNAGLPARKSLNRRGRVASRGNWRACPRALRRYACSPLTKASLLVAIHLHGSIDGMAMAFAEKGRFKSCHPDQRFPCQRRFWNVNSAACHKRAMLLVRFALPGSACRPCLDC